MLSPISTRRLPALVPQLPEDIHAGPVESAVANRVPARA